MCRFLTLLRNPCNTMYYVHSNCNEFPDGGMILWWRQLHPHSACEMPPFYTSSLNKMVAYRAAENHSHVNQKAYFNRYVFSPFSENLSRAVSSFGKGNVGYGGGGGTSVHKYQQSILTLLQNFQRESEKKKNKASGVSCTTALYWAHRETCTWGIILVIISLREAAINRV